MAGSTVYPGALDNFAEESPTNLGDNDSTSRTHAERHDDIESAMEAVQGELGTNPSGAYDTVAQRLAALDGDADFVTLESSGTAVVPLTVIGTASQAADLMQFKDSAGTAIATVSAAGAATFAGVESTGFTVGGTSIFDSPALSGTPTAPTAAVDTDTTQLATTAFVLAQAGTATPSASGTAAVGTSTLFARQDHDHGSTGAPLDSPTFTGTPAGPTASVDTNTTQLATTAFVVGQAGTATPVGNGTAAAGSSLRYSRQDHVHATDSSRAPLDSPTFTGTPAAPTAAVDTDTTQIATTAFVLAQAGTATPIVEGSATAGTATRFAREDHVHPSDGGGGGTGGSLPDVLMLMGA